jgi:hypothetical protein
MVSAWVYYFLAVPLRHDNLYNPSCQVSAKYRLGINALAFSLGIYPQAFLLDAQVWNERQKSTS